MKVSFRKSEKEIIADIRGGNSKVMESLYLQHRNEFVSWSVGKFGISEDDALDHFQDTMTIFFEGVMNSKITEIGSSLKTYLFGIGKNRIRQQFDAKNRGDKHEGGLTEHYQFLAEDEDASEAYEQARSQTSRLFESLGEACREILRLFYFEKRSMSEIATAMQHKNEAVTRTTKKRCLEKLRNEAKQPLTDG
ncbi:RNA polymerase sigma factor [Ekhidna sp. To15]|uniref:RNA polymerase sigma factor n=1 Tax=Ekhidna sp. To15 TaxID=3395267 RepID=UPI003F523C6B